MYADRYLNLAEACLRQAQVTGLEAARLELVNMAAEYRAKAARWTGQSSTQPRGSFTTVR